MINVTPVTVMGTDITAGAVTFIPYEQGPDSAIWRAGSGASRVLLALRRTQAKPTSTFPGTTRLSFKRTSYVTISSVEYTIVQEVVTSIPVPIAVADRTAEFTAFHIATRTTDFGLRSACEFDALPT